jgi:hypothetical protein
MKASRDEKPGVGRGERVMDYVNKPTANGKLVAWV